MTQVQIQQKSNVILCPYCKLQIGAEAISTCASCHTQMHRECYHANQGCAVFGCGGDHAVYEIIETNEGRERIRRRFSPLPDHLTDATGHVFTRDQLLQWPPEILQQVQEIDQSIQYADDRIEQIDRELIEKIKKFCSMLLTILGVVTMYFADRGENDDDFLFFLGAVTWIAGIIIAWYPRAGIRENN